MEYYIDGLSGKGVRAENSSLVEQLEAEPVDTFDNMPAPATG